MESKATGHFCVICRNCSTMQIDRSSIAYNLIIALLFVKLVISFYADNESDCWIVTKKGAITKRDDTFFGGRGWFRRLPP